MAKLNITVPELFAPVATLAVSGTAARSAAITSGILRVQPAVDCFILFGNGTVTATTSSHYLAAGRIYDLAYSGTNCSIITSGGTGNVYLSELK